MKKWTWFICAFFLIGIVAGCSSGHKRYHDQPLPDPNSFNAHFPDMDKNADDAVDWEEFKEYFPDADKKVFDVIDMNKDGVLDHDEWHAFKEAHGMGHKGGGYHKE